MGNTIHLGTTVEARNEDILAGEFFADGAQHIFSDETWEQYRRDCAWPWLGWFCAWVRTLNHSISLDRLAEMMWARTAAELARPSADVWHTRTYIDRVAVEIAAAVRSGVVQAGVYILLGLLVGILVGCEPAEAIIEATDSKISWMEGAFEPGSVCDAILDTQDCNCRKFPGLKAYLEANGVQIDDSIVEPGLCLIDPWDYCPLDDADEMGIGPLLGFAFHNNWCSIGKCLSVLKPETQSNETVGMCIPRYECSIHEDCKFLNLTSPLPGNKAWVCRDNLCQEESICPVCPECTDCDCIKAEESGGEGVGR